MKISFLTKIKNIIKFYINIYDYEKISKKRIILFNSDSIICLILPLMKIYIFLFVIFSLSRYNHINKLSYFNFNIKYLEIQRKQNLTFHNIIKNKNKLKIAIYVHCIKNGGRARLKKITNIVFLKILSE